MKNKAIYKITINNFEKHQKGLKRGHKAILISTGFLSDSKVRMLSPGGKLLFLSLLLLGGESTSSQVNVSHDSLCFQSGVKSGSLHSQLTMLQELQLVTVEKNEVLYNRIEMNRKEEKENERKRITKELTPEKKPDQNAVQEKKAPKHSKEDSEGNKKIWEEYANAYRLRYGVEPVKNITVNSKVSSLRKRMGVEVGIQIVKFYLSHNDGFYLKSTHSIGLCLRDCESLHTQMLRGKAITNTTVRQFEKTQGTLESLEHIRKHGI